MFAILVIDVVQHRRDRGRFARARDAGEQHQALVEIAQPFHGWRQIETLEIGNEVVDSPGDQADVAQLREHVHAEPPGRAVDFAGIGEVDAALFAKNSLPACVEHRRQQPDHFRGVDRVSIEGPQLALGAHDGRAADAHVQIAAFQLDDGLKDLVDLQLARVDSEPIEQNGTQIFVAIAG